MIIKIVAGDDVYAALQAEKEATVPKTDSGLYKSEPLCALQKAQAEHGILIAELCKSRYGWSVRYASGIQNWGLLASSRCNDVDGTFEDAARWASEWVSKDTARRYAFVKTD